MTAQGNPGPWGKRVEGLIVAETGELVKRISLKAFGVPRKVGVR